jgi:toxin-antitoxin system PIN domain toxin
VIVPDSNLLLHAHNTASPYYGAARKWWEECLSNREPVGLAYPVIFAFLRASTSAKVFPVPLTLTKASLHITRWLNRRVARLLNEGSDHVSRVVELLESAGSTGGNLVTDAQVAAIAMAHRATVHTADRDFQRFPGLDCRFPLSEGVRK